MNQWLPTILAALVTLGGGFFTYRASTKAADATVKVRTVEVDAAAYERARVMYEAGITQLEEQIARLRSQVNEERDASFRLRNQVNILEDLVARLKRQMILAGIDIANAAIPPVLTGAPDTKEN